MAAGAIGPATMTGAGETAGAGRGTVLKSGTTS
jgi:hypothetical protein